jgi:hypothetical protein
VRESNKGEKVRGRKSLAIKIYEQVEEDHEEEGETGLSYTTSRE